MPTSPVCLPVTGDPALRFLNHVRADLRDVQLLLNESPINKQAVISWIDTSLVLWKQWFADPRPDIERLTKGLAALRSALTKDSSIFAKEATSWRKVVERRTTVVDKYLCEVTTTCVSMDRITSTLEKQLAEQELRKRGYMNRAEEIKAQINNLEAELERVEKEYSHEDSLKAHTSHSLGSHRERRNDVATVQAQLKLLSAQDRDRLREVDQIMKDHVEMDELMSISARARGLRDFILACPSTDNSHVT